MAAGDTLDPDATAASAGDRALGIIATATVLGLLYFARDILVPVTLAFILSLLIAPLVRALRRIGLGQTWSVLAAVLMLAVSFGAVATVIGSQLVGMAANLPKYERTLERKLETLNRVTVGRINALAAQAGRAFNRHDEVEQPQPQPQTLAAPGAAVPKVPIPVELHEAPANPLQVLEKVLGSIWVPIETAGIVLVVLVFVLLEQEALRDRFIRIAGGTDIRLTTLVINEAGDRLSRFFVSQFAVNFGVGALVWIGLSIIGLPHPLVWAALTTMLRFVPYVGVWIAALSAALLAAAVDSGWSTAFATLGLFVGVELIAGAVGRAAAIRAHHGLVAAVGDHRCDFLELVVGADRIDRLDTLDAVFIGRRAPHQGIEPARYSFGRYSGADHAAAILSARAVRRFG